MTSSFAHKEATSTVLQVNGDSIGDLAQIVLEIVLDILWFLCSVVSGRHYKETIESPIQSPIRSPYGIHSISPIESPSPVGYKQTCDFQEAKNNRHTTTCFHYLTDDKVV